MRAPAVARNTAFAALATVVAASAVAGASAVTGLYARVGTLQHTLARQAQNAAVAPLPGMLLPPFAASLMPVTARPIPSPGPVFQPPSLAAFQATATPPQPAGRTPHSPARDGSQGHAGRPQHHKAAGTLAAPPSPQQCTAAMDVLGIGGCASIGG